jgi:hypothetical protein
MLNDNDNDIQMRTAMHTTAAAIAIIAIGVIIGTVMAHDIGTVIDGDDRIIYDVISPDAYGMYPMSMSMSGTCRFIFVMISMLILMMNGSMRVAIEFENEATHYNQNSDVQCVGDIAAMYTADACGKPACSCKHPSPPSPSLHLPLCQSHPLRYATSHIHLFMNE